MSPALSLDQHGFLRDCLQWLRPCPLLDLMTCSHRSYESKGQQAWGSGRGVSLTVNEQSLLWGEAHIPPRVHATEHSAHLTDYLCPHEPE